MDFSSAFLAYFPSSVPRRNDVYRLYLSYPSPESSLRESESKMVWNSNILPHMDDNTHGIQFSELAKNGQIRRIKLNLTVI